MNYPNLTEDLFKKSANTYFISNGESVVNADGIFEKTNNKLVQRYPNKNKAPILSGVYVKSNHFNFWNIIQKYLPQGCFISHAYVSPEYQARVGIKLLESKYPTFDLSQLIGNETNPELIGKYKDLYLFQLNYDKVKQLLSNYSINWSKPNTTVHQRGLALDITFNSEYYDIVVGIIKWFYVNNNHILNLSGVFIKQSDTEIHIEFNEDSSNINSITGNTFLITNGINSPVSEFLKDKDGRFYEIMKNNGHIDLIDTSINKQMLSKMPNHSKKNNSSLAKAFREILDDSLGGQGGIISSLVQGQLDYSMSLINGLMGAVSVLADELDSLTEGRASILIKEAIESEIEKTSDNNFIKNKALDMSPILPEDSKILRNKENIVSSTSKTNIRKSRIAISNNNRNISRKDPKTTPDQTEFTYDNLRVVSNKIESHVLTYDHFGDMTNEFVINLEKNIGKYSISISDVYIKIINHNLNSLNVKAYAKDLNGSSVIFSQKTINKDSIEISFSPSFSGTIEVY